LDNAIPYDLMSIFGDEVACLRTRV
jgi:hypothetical protein